jgi:hypothetical protein
MNWAQRVGVISALLAFLVMPWSSAENLAAAKVPENLYKGELVSYPGPWAFMIPRSHIILVNDEQLEALANPDTPVNLSLTFDKREESLRQICERAQAAGQRTLIMAFDHFFAQYRPSEGDKPRRLTPDKEEYIQRIAEISKFAAQYGIGLELSLLSPLEIGPAYAEETGEQGLWMHYRKGLRDPKTGDYSVELWRQCGWSNNKGPVSIEDAGVRVFAFRQKAMHGTGHIAVAPEDIVETTDTAQVEVFENITRGTKEYRAVRVRVHGTGKEDGRDRVMVVQMYRTPEMDYFSENALPYLEKLCDRYADAGVKLNGLYSDEMHIQQDWGYFSHHDDGEFALRYVSPGLAKRYAEKYGAQYADFAKWMVYFVFGQEDFENDLSAKQDISHVFGAAPEDIQRTALFRSRYYSLLQDGVVDLFTAAKRHMEERMGYRLEARAHATWAESPTIDKWNTGQAHLAANQYEYTSNFVWSCTVQQASAACADYFKWGDYLTGNGNDHAEGGWLDRNYYALALACSTGSINEVPYSYGAHWGMPDAISERRSAVQTAFGAAGAPFHSMVQDMQHRDVSVLMLYPLDLVAANERFGSWMTQYGYANQITQAKLLEMGRVNNGGIDIAGCRYTTLVTLFEPFPSKKMLSMMQEMAGGGGRVIWSGPPPVLDADGDLAGAAWSAISGCAYTPRADDGLIAPGRQVAFEGSLAPVPMMTVLTDFVVDRLHPLVAAEGTEVVARSRNHVVGTRKAFPGGGSFTALAFRPRDDQAASLGYETRQWFEILNSLGAYAPTGVFGAQNDNTEYLSRTTDYLACRFPNGAVSIAPHLRSVEESWPGGFARKPDQDAGIMAGIILPNDRTALEGFKVNGHEVTYNGRLTATFRVDDQKRLIAFCGSDAQKISVDGIVTEFADKPMPLVAWAPVLTSRTVDKGAVIELFYSGEAMLRIPAPGLSGPVDVVAEGSKPGSRGEALESSLQDGLLQVRAASQFANRWIYVVPKQ